MPISCHQIQCCSMPIVMKRQCRWYETLCNLGCKRLIPNFLWSKVIRNLRWVPVKFLVSVFWDNSIICAQNVILKLDKLDAHKRHETRINFLEIFIDHIVQFCRYFYSCRSTTNNDKAQKLLPYLPTMSITLESQSQLIESRNLSTRSLEVVQQYTSVCKLHSTT